ncbi:BTAD domain-containing putative transcriptional regulator [Nocardia aurea]|uniref:BTAD domain-containing putative transcriptional regulator n=1 Tax=Nocardia aurea TaxID=2144174 RepID=UPI0033BFA822
MRISVLGPIRVEFGAGVADPGTGRQLAVLIRLLAAGGRVVSTDRLIDDLWNGEPPPKALAALQVHVSNLRRILEPDRPPRAPARILVSEQPGYALRLPENGVDAWEFDALISADADAEADPAARYRRLTTALALWRGDPFGAFAAESWAEAEAARLHALRLSAVEYRAATALELGRADEVAHLLPAECAQHPAREELFRLLALAQYRLGRQADALATLRTVREYLSEELGVDPGPAVRQLEVDILGHSPALVARPAEPEVVTEPRGGDARAGAEHREFAGREKELATLTRTAESVRTSGLRVVWVVAEAGGGKSTFAETLAARLRARGWTAATAHCPEVDGAPAAWAWRELLGELGDGADVADPFDIARAVVTACRDHPDGVLLVVDDVHRADSATLQVLRQTIAWMRQLPVLVVATYRPSEAGAELSATAAALVAVTADRLELAGLSDDGIREVARSAGLDPLDTPTLELLRARTDGNPLFVGELAKWVASRGVREALTSLPGGIRDVLLRRVDRLPAEVGRMLRLASVCGRSTAIDTLLALWTSPGSTDGEDELLDAIDTAAVAGLLTADTELVVFRHVLIRDALYESIPALRLRRLHWRTMGYLESLPNPDADELAYHAARGATPQTVEHALGHVETAARARFDSEFRADSAPLWRFAVELRDSAGHGEPGAPAADRAALVTALCALVTALAHRGEVSLARSVRARALSLAQRDGDERLALLALTSWRTPRIWTTREQRLADTQMTSAVLAALPGTTGADRVRLLVTAVFEFEGNDTPFTIECATEAARLAREIGDSELSCAALNALAYTALGPDLNTELPAVTEEFLTVAADSGIIVYRAAAHYYRFLAHLSRTDLLSAASEVRLGLETASSGRVGELVVVLSAFDAVLDVLRGDLDQAAGRYADLAARLTAAGLANGAEIGLVGQMVIAWFRGSLAHLVEPLSLSYDYAPQTISWVYVVALLDAGREADARVVAERDHEVGRDFYWTALSVFQARALVRLGMRNRASILYEELRHWSGTVAGLNSASVTFGPMDDVLAELADLLGDTEATTMHRDRAADVREQVAAALAAMVSPR